LIVPFKPPIYSRFWQAGSLGDLADRQVFGQHPVADALSLTFARLVAECGGLRTNEAAMMLGCLRGSRERDDRDLLKAATPAPQEVDPIEELSRIVGEAQDRNAKDELRFERQAREHREASALPPRSAPAVVTFASRRMMRFNIKLAVDP
jgi:hypothetical protein